jgi:hypothetical protein
MSKLITIYGTGKAATMPQGSVWQESEDMAKILVDNGAATYEEKEKAEQEPEKKKEVKPTSKKVK